MQVLQILRDIKTPSDASEWLAEHDSWHPDDIVDLAEEAQFDRAHDASDYEVLPCSCYDVTVTLRPQV